jgi:hypothetical protein
MCKFQTKFRFAKNMTYERQKFCETEINRHFINFVWQLLYIPVKRYTMQIEMIREQHKSCLDTIRMSMISTTFHEDFKTTRRPSHKVTNWLHCIYYHTNDRNEDNSKYRHDRREQTLEKQKRNRSEVEARSIERT